MVKSNYHILIEKLDEFIRKYYKNRLIKGIIYSVSLMLVSYLVVTVLEYFAHFDTVIRTILFYSFLAATSYVLVKFIAIPLLKLNRLGDTISHDQAASIIGDHFGEVKDKLLNTLQLKRQFEANNMQAELIEASINQKIVELKPVPFTSAINIRDNRKYLKYAIVPVLVMLSIVLSSPGVITESTARLVNHGTYFEKLAPFQFIIENNTLEAIQQEDFELMVKLLGDEIPESVYIEFDDNRFKLKKDNTISFRHQFKNIQHPIAFRFFADGFYSKKYKLNALPNPLILNFDVTLDYPSYTEKKDEAIKNTGNLVVPAGTKIQWKFKTKDTDALRMVFLDSIYELPLSEKNLFVFHQRFLKSKSYLITTRNEFLNGRDSISYAINVITDQYPGIDVDERADSLSSKRIYFRGMIKDDYGFKKLNFNYRFINKKEDQPEVEGGSEHVQINASSTQDQFFHLWNLETLDIQAGDQIEYYFEVWDNDGVNGSKSTKSQKKVFKAPTLKELAKQKEQTNEKIKDDLEESLKEAKDLQRDLEKLDKKMLEKKKLGWDEKKQIKDLLNRQKELERTIDNIKQENSEMQNKQKEYQKPSESNLEKQKQLEDLFEQVMTEEMKEMFRELEELLDELDKEKIKEMMDEMKLTNEDIEKELDRTLEIFKQLEFDQKLEETIEKLEELKEKQEELSEETKDKKSDSEEMKEKQEELNEEFQDVKKDIDDLEKKNDDLEFPKKMDDTKQQEQEIDQEMNKSSEQLQDNKKKKASESQKGASGKMGELADQLKQMQGDMEMESNEEDLDALRQLLENLVQLSFDQEDLMVELQKTNKNDPKYVKISKQQRRLKDNAKMIEDSLFALSKRQPQIEAIVNREMNSVNQNLKKTIDYLSELQTPLATSRQQTVMTSVNNLALLLDEIVQQMQQAMSENKFGNKSCNKPGNCKKPGGAGLKKMQQQLNKQIKAMKEGMNNPGGQKGKKQMSKELAKMAAQQEAIRNEVQKMAEGMNKESEKEGKGNLGNIAKMMEETETDLVNKQITRETLKRQQDIMVRLLQAEKAERERELDEKRESNEAKNENISNPAEFFEYNRLKQKEAELLKTVPPTLNPFYKNKVNAYFNTFE